MRTHGWAGNTPVSDEEAIERILATARRHIDERGSAMRIADVARELGVTRQTVYRYFPSTEALLQHTAMEEADSFLDGLAGHLQGIHDPAEAVVEGIAHTLESLPKDKYLGLLITPGRAGANSAGITSDAAFLIGRSIVERYDLDWEAAGYDEGALNGLVEFMLRITQSFVVDPGRPPREGRELRDFLREWVAPAVAFHARGSAPRPKAAGA
jgi:AcrR family transcriptional regulator